MRYATRVAVAISFLLALHSAAQAQIYNWQTGAVIDGTKDITPGPGIQLNNWNTVSKNLQYADFSGTDLTGASFYKSWLDYANFAGVDLRGVSLSTDSLTNANFCGANLTGQHFWLDTLTNANFTDALVAGAIFDYAFGFTKEQLYSTASYKGKDLHGISLFGSDFSGSDFSGCNLAGASISNLTGANLSGASLVGATLTGLANANLSGANLSNAVLPATLAGADLTNSVIAGANFESARSFTKEQLYSTASYKNKDLTGINLNQLDLTGWSFAGQNLTGATILSYRPSTGTGTPTIMTNTDFTDAIIAGTCFYNSGNYYTGLTPSQMYSTASYKNRDLHGITLGGGYACLNWNFVGQDLVGAYLIGQFNYGSSWANFTCADLRGAYYGSLGYSNCRNTIYWNGVVNLRLLDGDALTVCDYNVPIVASGWMSMTSASTLRMLFSDATWGSTISPAAGVVPQLNGTLDLELALGVKAKAVANQTFQLFNWGQTLASGNRFATILTPKGLVCDLSNLYTAGTVSLEYAGDYNQDGKVNDADYTIWADYFKRTPLANYQRGDDPSGGYDDADYTNWANNFTGDGMPVPEPASLSLLGMGLLGMIRRRKV